VLFLKASDVLSAVGRQLVTFEQTMIYIASILLLLSVALAEPVTYTERRCAGAQDTSPGLELTETKVDAQPRIVWAGGNHSTVVFALSDATNALYRSTNNGKTWTDQSRNGALRPTFEESRVASLVRSRSEEMHLYALSYDRKSSKCIYCVL
jgi:hypothetical protein